MKLKPLFITMMLLAIISSVAALELRLNTPDQLSLEKNGQVILEPGAPMLPFYAARVLIPFGKSVSDVQVHLENPQMMRADVIPPMARMQQPVSMPAADTTIPNPDIWNQNAFWPNEDHRFLGIQYQRGYQVAVISIYPYKYNPITQEWMIYQNINISIGEQRSPGLDSYQANMLRSDEAALKELQELVINPDAASSYAFAERYRNHQPYSRLIDLSTPKKMIIITSADRYDTFLDYAQWRSSKGISTGIFKTSDIYSEYTGADRAAKIRAFITDAYQSWANTSAPLEYVILGGDDELVPERGAYGQVWQTIDTKMPTDMYFGNLDGDWNANGNDIYGEPDDDVDMLAEVHIGRFPAEAEAEFENMFRKTRYYVENTTFSNNVSLMIGENLNWNPVTWGGDYKDDVAIHVPGSYKLKTLYQRDGTYDGPSVWDAINDGANAMNHMGHANENTLIGQGSGTVKRFNNTEYGFLYTQGCYPAAFDQRTSGDGECIGEHFVISSGGLFAFIGNTRYGWYMPGGIDGASQFFDRQFFIGLYEAGNPQLGKALAYSKAQNLNYALSSDVMRWCYYEVVLFGDPSVSVKLPDAAMPYLSLESYEFSDIDGDGDGSFNPGERIRLYPRIRNHEGWAHANSVHVSFSVLAEGITPVTSEIIIPSLPSGQLSDEGLYLSFDLPATLPFGTFNLEISIDALHPVTQQSIGIRRFNASFEITLIDNRFPWDCEISTRSAPIVFDFDGDGALDIMYLDVFGQAYLIDQEGQQFDGFEAPDAQNIMRSSALGDITGDGIPEHVFTSRMGKVYATSLDGSLVFSYSADTSFLFTPVLADIDGDGIDEVIVHSFDKRLFAFKGDGALMPGFPISLNSNIPSELAAADLDGDGFYEIIFGTQNGYLLVIKGDGSDYPGFPINVEGSVMGSPVVLENNRIAIGAGAKMILVEPGGEIVFAKETDTATHIGAVPARLNWDGSTELVFTTLSGKIYAIDQAGNDIPGFPIDSGAIFSSPPLIADMGEDSRPEIILQTYMNSMLVYRHDGSMLPGFPFGTDFNGNTPGTLTDLDGDGILRLVSGYSTGVLVINLRRPVTTRMPWVIYRGGLKRQGSYASTGYVDTPQDTAPPVVDRLRQNYPNPFNPNTTISFDLEKPGRVRLSIYNLKGQMVRKLIDGRLDAGTKSAVWDGRDHSGQAVASGVYFYRLETPRGSQTLRMLLMK